MSNEQPDNELWSVIECNLRNIFVEKSYTKCAAEAIPRSLSKKLELNISLDQ